MPEENIKVIPKTKTYAKECVSCKWWMVMKPTPETADIWGMSEFPFGECRHSPPTALSGDTKYPCAMDETGQLFVNIKQARFPHSFPEDWCGGWEIRKK